MLYGLHDTGISGQGFWNFHKVTHKSNFILWLHPSLDNLALIAIGHQISSTFIHVFKVEVTRNYIPGYGSSFID